MGVVCYQVNSVGRNEKLLGVTLLAWAVEDRLLVKLSEGLWDLEAEELKLVVGLLPDSSENMLPRLGLRPEEAKRPSNLWLTDMPTWGLGKGGYLAIPNSMVEVMPITVSK